MRLATVFVSCFAIFNATDLIAATYWSIGSYSDESNALNEAARVESVLSSAVFIQSPSSGNANYRLLIAADDITVKPLLDEIGVNGVWLVTVSGNLAKGSCFLKLAINLRILKKKPTSL